MTHRLIFCQGFAGSAGILIVGHWPQPGCEHCLPGDTLALCGNDVLASKLQTYHIGQFFWITIFLIQWYSIKTLALKLHFFLVLFLTVAWFFSNPVNRSWGALSWRRFAVSPLHPAHVSWPKKRNMWRGGTMASLSTVYMIFPYLSYGFWVSNDCNSLLQVVLAMEMLVRYGRWGDELLLYFFEPQERIPILAQDQNGDEHNSCLSIAPQKVRSRCHSVVCLK